MLILPFFDSKKKKTGSPFYSCNSKKKKTGATTATCRGSTQSSSKEREGAKKKKKRLKSIIHMYKSEQSPPHDAQRCQPPKQTNRKKKREQERNIVHASRGTIIAVIHSKREGKKRGKKNEATTGVSYWYQCSTDTTNADKTVLFLSLT